MLRVSSPCRRRPRGRFVLKYLEGIPTPTKLVDHMAGADLSSSPWTDFLSTVPRYINAEHEQRLSKLFFHHVLYPAGGARRPYQAVVVRAGRMVAPSPVVVTRTSATAATRAVVAAPVKDPLAVPEAWRHTTASSSGSATTTSASTSTLNASAAEVRLPTSQQWARADPARQAYFFSSSSPSVKAAASSGARGVDADGSGGGGGGGRFDFDMGRPRFSTWHAPASSASAASASTSGLGGSGADAGGQGQGQGQGQGRGHVPLVEMATRRGAGGSGRAAAEKAEAEAEQVERATTDDAFRGLRGVVEGYWDALLAQEADASASTEAVVEALCRLQVNPSAGRLLFGSAVPMTKTTSADPPRASPCEVPAAAIVTDDTPALLSTLMATALRTPHSARAERVVYVPTRLPPVAFAHVDAATTTAPAPGKTEAKVRLSRLAGGVMPHVSFAVGRPLADNASPTSATTSSVSTGGVKAGEDDASARALATAPGGFAHLTALLRLGVAAPAVVDAAETRPAVDAQAPATADARAHRATGLPLSTSSASWTPPSWTEPWRLGQALDLAVPYVARTVAERVEPVYVHVPGLHSTHADTSSRETGAASVPDGAVMGIGPHVHARVVPHRPGEACYECVLGRQDAETYLLPQRELLIELLVPEETHQLCAQQNQERVARQARLGHGGPAQTGSGSGETQDFAWPAHQRRTAERAARGRLLNMDEASAPPTPRAGSAPSTLSASAAAAAFRPPQLVYEVRALPGDVLYIPRRWGYRVKRMTGTSVLATASTETRVEGAAVGQPPPRGIFSPSTASAVCAPSPSASFGSSTPTNPISPTRPVTTSTSSAEAPRAPTQAGRITSVSVDAWCIMYAPYPDLSAEQASVYMPANYVQRGIEEFYEKGGNDVYHPYE